MQFKMLEQGNDGAQHYNPGDTVDRPSEWMLRCLISKAAEPADDEAAAWTERMVARVSGEH